MLTLDPATVTAAASVLAAATAIVGVPLILKQLNEARAAAQLAAKVARSQLYGTVADGMDRLNQFLGLHPDMLGYLYEDREPPPPNADAKLTGWLELMCEEFMDFADSVNEQRRSLPAGMDWSTWDAYFRYCYRNSHVLRRYVDANLAFYPDYTLAPLGYIVVRHPLDGQVLSTWIAREVLLSDSTQPAGHDDDSSLLLQRFKLQPADLPPRGYPWVTTWVFSTYRGPDVEPEPEVLMSVRVVNEREAEVTTRSMSRIDEEGAATLRSWVVDGMRGVGLDFVYFHQAGEVHRYDLVKLGLSGRRTFELPRFRSHH